VANSKYAVDDPTYLCERCLRNTHYTEVEEASISEVNTTNNGSNEASGVRTEQGTKPKRLKKLFDFKAFHFSQV
jgi:hypothetical protein